MFWKKKKKLSKKEKEMFDVEYAILKSLEGLSHNDAEIVLWEAMSSLNHIKNNSIFMVRDQNDE